MPGVLLCCPVCQAHGVAPLGWGPTLVQCIRRLMGQPLYWSAADAGMWGERLWGRLHPLHMTQQYRLASMAAWLSSTGISHHNFLSHIPSVRLSAVNSSPLPGIAQQSLNSSSSRCTLQGTCVPVWGMYGCGKDCLILIPFRLQQISFFPCRFNCFSSDSDALMWGSDPCSHFPTHRGQVQSY